LFLPLKETKHQAAYHILFLSSADSVMRVKSKWQIKCSRAVSLTKLLFLFVPPKHLGMI
jgi:hypothetical protein